MDKKILDRFRQFLTSHRDNLLEWLNTDSNNKKVHIGSATMNEVSQVISEHNAALERINHGEFGRCSVCDGEVKTEQLELDFTTCVCLDHYSESQIRILERDLELAAKVQRQLLPYSVPLIPGVHIAAHTEPAQIVGGDYFDFFSYPDGDQGIAIADVMGKGLSASMLMSNLQASLRILGPEHKEMHIIATRLNELFRYNLKLIRFISLFLARIDTKAGTLQYCNAGHNPAILWNSASKSIHWLKPTGPAIGLTHNAEFKSKELQFADGDLLVLYTDGLVDARNSVGEEFGENQLAIFVKDHHNKPTDIFLAKLRETVESFAEKFHDDITLMVIKFQ